MNFNRSDYLTVEEVAQYFGLDEGTIRKYYREGDLYGRRSGLGPRAQILIAKKAVEELDRRFERETPRR